MTATRKWLFDIYLYPCSVYNPPQYNNNKIRACYYVFDVYLESKWNFGFEFNWYSIPLESFKIGPFRIGYTYEAGWVDKKRVNTKVTLKEHMKRIHKIDKIINIFEKLFKTKYKLCAKDISYTILEMENKHE